MNMDINTDRQVKWSESAWDFFNSSQDNSIDLNMIISYGCASQSGEGFEDLVNSINSEKIKCKIKSLNIVDTSYLYRHVITGFDKYANDMQTLWFLKNEAYIKTLPANTNLKGWKEGISSDSFKRWHKQILLDYSGDENGNNIVRNFRDLVIADASVAAYKGNNNLQDSVDFLLEEIAYVCANFKNPTTYLIYPMTLATSMVDAATRYSINIFHLRYKTSKQSQKSCKHTSLNSESIDAEVALFMKERVSNINFFVIDKYGNHIYKNYALDKVIGDINAKKLDTKAWQINTDVMKTRKQVMVEEEYRGIKYLSVKSPLIIDGEVEGVIGLAVDITDRKKTADLEWKNKLQKIKLDDQNKFREFTSRMAHDIVSPLVSLELVLDCCKDLPESRHVLLRDAATSIRNISDALLNRYKSDLQEDYSKEEQHILVALALTETVRQKKYEYKNSNIEFHYSSNPSMNFTFILGDQCNFNRMISNLINNSVEAFEGKPGDVEVTMEAENRSVKITIKDTGKGMPKEMIDKILADIPIETTKITGHGIGLGQIMHTLSLYNGKMSIDSQEGVGTTIEIAFPESDAPDWIANQVTLRKEDTFIILDDDEAVHDIWRERLKDYSGILNLNFFTKGRDAIQFIDSCHKKENIFMLCDYDLRDTASGLQLILENDMQRQALMVTGIHNDRMVQDFIERSGLKILPKQFLGDIAIIVE